MIKITTKCEKVIVRLFLMGSLAYFMFPWVHFSVTQVLEMRGASEKDAVFEEEKGMGGVSYLEVVSVSALNQSSADTAVMPDIIEPAAVFAEAEKTTALVIPDPESGEPGVPEPVEYSKPHILISTAYKVEQGDIIGKIAMKFGLNQDTLISFNNIKNTRLLQIGQTLRVPNQDGIMYTVKKGDTLSAIAELFEVDQNAIMTVNELFSDVLKVGTSLFIPGARLELVDLQEINGDLFAWPIRGRITSLYGYRPNPFNPKDGTRQFHSGLDIAAAAGTPIKAAQSGRVSTVSNDASFGNYVVISHHSGYRTLYAHMSVVRVKAGAYVTAGQRIGDVGSTGRSTGPHLHFTVYKNGVTVNPLNLVK
ncbi:MAG: peptidoglycan DD-metalloendopeptidase family protein [Treponema sp.]|jgi:murein DD-endopeptidase MepM/ murein hydrolase activator NlpD|nr:peptidoglycan DD-metalloendopeptidase family protein [Treponema sp.]